MNYKKVIEDYKSGVIDKDDWALRFFDWGGRWHYVGVDEYDLEVEEVEKREDQMKAKYGTPDNPEDVVAVLKAVGVRAEWGDS